MGIMIHWVEGARRRRALCAGLVGRGGRGKGRVRAGDAYPPGSLYCEKERRAPQARR